MILARKLFFSALDFFRGPDLNDTGSIAAETAD